MPPKMTTAKMVSENAKPNTPGVARRNQADSIAPENAASAEVRPKTATLYANTFLPSACVAMGSSRSPLSTRPIGDSPMR